MIFVTVGTQLAFPRLMSAVAALVPALEEQVVAQTGPDSVRYRGMTCHMSLPPAAFAQAFQEARVVVAHAGIGTILSAQRWRKPLVLLPRRHALGEHRNDHQLATARALSNRPGLHIAWETDALGALLTAPDLTPADDTPGPERDRLVARIRDFIAE